MFILKIYEWSHRYPVLKCRELLNRGVLNCRDHCTLVPISSPHPYVFFNLDNPVQQERHTMTFVGFKVNSQTGDIQDPRTNEVLERGVIPRRLQAGLARQKVPLNENFDALDR